MFKQPARQRFGLRLVRLPYSRTSWPPRMGDPAATRASATAVLPCRHNQDPVAVTDGLPELTAYFLRNEVPRIRPKTLFQDCNPPSAEGLITQPIAPRNATGKTRHRCVPEGHHAKRVLGALGACLPAGYCTGPHGCQPDSIYRPSNGVWSCCAAARGWRRTVLYGNCVMIDVQLWFRPDVQR